MTGLSIDVIKNQIQLSKMFVGSEAVSKIRYNYQKCL